MANLRRLSPTTLTFLIFFYSTTLLTSYLYPLDLAPNRILTIAVGLCVMPTLTICVVCAEQRA